MKLLTLLTSIVFISISSQSQDIPNQATDIAPLLIGESVPAIELADISGKSVSLNELISRKQTVLVFYRGGWCPYCNTHLSELQSIEEKILGAGYQIVAVSPDSPGNLKESVDKNKLKYTLLSDSKTNGCRAFGLAFKAPEKYGDLLARSSENLNKNILPVPAVFVLNKQGEILFEFINPDYKKRLKGSLLLAVLNELKE